MGRDRLGTRYLVLRPSTFRLFVLAPLLLFVPSSFFAVVLYETVRNLVANYYGPSTGTTPVESLAILLATLLILIPYFSYSIAWLRGRGCSPLKRALLIATQLTFLWIALGVSRPVP